MNPRRSCERCVGDGHNKADKVCETGNTSSSRILEMLRRPGGATLTELLTLRRITGKPLESRLAAGKKVVMAFKTAYGYNIEVWARRR